MSTFEGIMLNMLYNIKYYLSNRCETETKYEAT